MQRIRKFERSLVEGNWFDHAKSTKTFGFTGAELIAMAVVAGSAVTAGAAIYDTSVQAGIANKALGLSASQADKQNQAYMQLQQLIKDPASFFTSPVYKTSADQGSQAVARQNAAQFGPNSGNEATALQMFGQSYGSQQLLGQEQLLAGMSGTGFNPAGAISTASGAASSAAGSLASLGGLMSFFGSSNTGNNFGADAAGGTGSSASNLGQSIMADGGY